MTDEQKTRIKNYVKTINEAAEDATNDSILEFAVEDVAARVLLYLNCEELPENIERIVARIVSGIFNQTLNSSTTTQVDSAISSLSDNGQSISFANEVKNYLVSTDDNEIFAGFTKLLAPYRRINVVA